MASEHTILPELTMPMPDIRLRYCTVHGRQYVMVPARKELADE